MDISIYEGRNQFSKIIEAAERGETTTVRKRGKPVARVVPIDDAEARETGVQRALEIAERAGARITARKGRRFTHEELMEGKEEGRR